MAFCSKIRGERREKKKRGEIRNRVLRSVYKANVARKSFDISPVANQNRALFQTGTTSKKHTSNTSFRRQQSLLSCGFFFLSALLLRQVQNHDGHTDDRKQPTCHPEENRQQARYAQRASSARKHNAYCDGQPDNRTTPPLSSGGARPTNSNKHDNMAG